MRVARGVHVDRGMTKTIGELVTCSDIDSGLRHITGAGKWYRGQREAHLGVILALDAVASMDRAGTAAGEYAVGYAAALNDVERELTRMAGAGR